MELRSCKSSHPKNCTILASIHDQIAVLDQNGVIIETNQSWRRFVEHADSQTFERARMGDQYLETCAVAAAGGDATAAELLDCIREVLADLTVRRRMEFSRETPGSGVLWHEISIERLHRPEGGAVITRADITAQKRAMSEAREQRQQLAHLGRAAILGELSGAHLPRCFQFPFQGAEAVALRQAHGGK